MTILLINPPVYEETMMSGPPLGMATLTSAVKEHGIKADQFNLHPRD